VRSASRSSLLATGLLLLASCGGGGGGGGDDPTAPQLNLSASTVSILAGASVTFTWTSQRAYQCTASGSWGGDAGNNGSVGFVFETPGSYTFVMTCEGPGGRVTESVVVEVTDPSRTRITLLAEPSAVAVGATTTLTWSSSGDSCEASGAWSGSRAATGSEVVLIPDEGGNVFVLECSGAQGTSTGGVYVDGLQATLDLEAAPTIAGAGQSTTLTWNTTTATSCTASGAWSGPKPNRGSEPVTLGGLGDHEFTLTCGDPGADATQSVTVTAAAPAIVFRAFPPNPAPGESYSLNWDVKYATSCSASGAWSGSRPLRGTTLRTAGLAGSLQYSLACTNAATTTTVDATVTVTPPPALPPATAFRMTANHGASVTFDSELTFPSAPAWSLTFEEEVSYPVIADGSAFVTVAKADGSGSTLHAIDLATGQPAWGPVVFDTPGERFSGVTYENGALFVITGNGMLHSFDAATGAPGWSVQLEGQWSFTSPPVAFGGLVFAVGAGIGGTAYAVEQSDGELLWRADLPNVGGNGSPAVTPTGLYITQACVALALAPITGELTWGQPGDCTGGIDSTAVVKDGVVYGRHFNSDLFHHNLTFFDADNGEIEETGTTWVLPAVTATHYFVVNDGVLEAYSTSTRARLWTFRADMRSSPIVVNDVVFDVASNGRVFAVDVATGEELWHGDIGIPPFIPLDYPYEHGSAWPRLGEAAGEGYLVVPTQKKVMTAWKITP
jgi:outer membrane protein assembly factor BamB